MKKLVLVAIGSLIASMLLWAEPAFASYASRCSGCHFGTAVGALPNGTQRSGSIRAANNRAYLDAMINAGMATVAMVPVAERDGIVAEIGNSGSVAGASINSAAPPGGTVGISYSFSVTASGAPQLGLGSTSLDGDPLPNGFSLVAGAWPPGLAINGSSGLISGTPTTAGTFTGTVQANNFVGASNQNFSITIVAPPSNDNFGSSATLTGGNTSATASSTNATKEAGEPNHAGNAGGHSLWWSWTAPSTNPVKLNTCYSTFFFNGTTFIPINLTFDTLLAVYTGNAVNALTAIASNDDAGANCSFATSSFLTFNATQGTTYRFAVDGYNGVSGNVRLSLYQEQILKVIAFADVGASGLVVSDVGGINCLNAACQVSLAPATVVTLTATPQAGSAFGGWIGAGCTGYQPTCVVTVDTFKQAVAIFRAMPNDDFANRIVLGAGVTTGFGYNSTATKEVGEPNHAAGNAGGKSLWWTWTAPTTGSANISLAGSDFDTLLGVYTGSAVNALTTVASNDDFNVTPQSSATFYATAGTQYHFAVDGYNAKFGTINFAIKQPGNDNFVGRLPVSGGTINVVDTNVGASRETGEPLIFGNAGGHSLWWTWTAPSTDTVTIDTSGGNIDTVLGVYTGLAVNALTLVASNDDCGLSCVPAASSKVTFAATAGTTYQIAVDGYNGITGIIHLNILQRQPQTITFPLPGNSTYGTAPFALTASTSSGLPVTLTSNTPGVCTVAGLTLTIVTAGSCTIVASQAGTPSFYPAANVTQTFSILKASQAITFGAQASQNYSTGGIFAINPAATASSSLPVGYTSNSLSICTISGSVVTMVSVGACSITASQPGDANFNAAANATQVITINPGPQTIAFGAQSAVSFSPGGTVPINPLASASSGLPVTYSVTTPVVCSVAGTTVSILTAGTCTIAANQAGNSNFNPASQVTQNLLINATAPGAPVIGIATPGDTQATIAFAPPSTNGGSAITSYRATCNSGGFNASAASSPITVTGLANGTLYSCSVTATNGVGTGGASGNVGVTPNATPVPPQITSLASTTFTITQAGLFTATATGTPAPTLSLSGSLPTGVTFTPATGALAGTPATGTAGSYPVTISATNGSGTVMQAFTLTVQKATQTISFNNPGAQNFSATSLPLVASAAPSGLTVAFASNTPATCTVAGSNLTMVSVGSCTVVASQAGDGSYSAASPVQQTFSIGVGAQTITFAVQSVASRAYAPGGTFAINPLASASSGLAVTYSSTTPAVCSVSGTNVTMVAAGTCTIQASQSGNGNYSAATPVQRSVTITSTVPDAPTIGTATPGDTQASIAFTPPANTGGIPISQYTATCNPGGIAAVGASSPISVPGLTNNVTYTCSVTASNATGTSAASGSVQVTPFTATGSSLWTNKCVGCHATALPSGNRLNGGGSTENVLNYVIIHQPLMAANAGVTALTANERAAIAAYILSVAPPVTGTTAFNTPLPLDVGSNLVLNSATGTFTSVEVVTAPSHGSLSVAGFTGTTITYTPNNGYTGSDSFTYRGRNIGAALSGDPRSVSITVLPASPVISSSLSANGTVFQPFSYQISASNLPTSYGTGALPAGLGVDTNTGLISGTPTVAGVFNVGISASNAGGTDNKSLSINLGRATQVIVFPAQTVASRAFSVGGNFSVNPVATGGGSNNAITYGSSTTGVCTVAGSTVTMVFGGTCTITADQLGNATYFDAPTATQVVTITPIQPGPPVIGIATPGNNSATVSFSPPAATGGATISQYTVTCDNGAVPANGASSPVTVTQLTNGVQYTCSVTATSAGGTSVASGTVMVTPTVAGVAPVFTSSNATTFTVTQAGNFVVTASGTPAPTLSISGPALPSGVTFTPATGVLAGTPALGTVAPYAVTFSAMNASGTAMQSFTLTVQKASQSIAFPNPGPQNFSAAPIAVSATASPSSLTVSFASNTPAVCTVSGSSVNMLTTGSCTIVANQAGDGNYAAASNVQQTFLIGMGAQSINFPAQSTASRSYAPGGTFSINPLATASSGLPVTYSSTTPAVCSVSSTTVTMLGTGTCTIAANQSGDANYTAAVQATSNVAITAGAPTAPVITGVTAGDTKAIVNFNPPADTGGSAITLYTATCGGANASDTTSPIVVTGLTNGNNVTCRVTATNAIGTGPVSNGVSVTPLLNDGTTLFAQICTACHITPPTVPQLNAAGSTATVLSYVITNVQTMAAVPTVASLTTAERVALAQYLQSQLPTAPEVTPYNAPKLIDVISQIAVGGISFQTLEVVAMPQHGTLSVFSGTSITYTPTAGYVGSDSFTFRGVRSTPTSFVGDTRTLNITVSPPPPPVITSATSTSGTNGVAFLYQITATNSPTSFTASGLPAGLTVDTSTGLISGTPSVGGSFPVNLTASNAGGSSSVVQLTISLNPTSQVITFLAQSPASQPFNLPPSNTFAINPAATASSGLPITYVSKTPAICTVSGATVTILAAGTCTIGANQGGDASFTVASEVTRSVTIAPSLPGAPIIGTATAGDKQLAIAFTPPTNTGGTNITLYTASCTPSGTGTNSVSPVVVSALTNNQAYQCSVTATNSAGTGPASAAVGGTPQPTPTAPTITSAASTTFTFNAPGSFAVTATGTPAPSSYAATGTLPTGITFNTTTGVLSGTPTQAGTFMLTVSATNASGTAMQAFTLTVMSANQSISFNNPGTKTFGAPPVPLSAIATSGLVVLFVSDTPGVCTIAGSSAVLVSAGTCTIRAQQAGDANFTPATDVPQSFSVLQGSQTISFGAQASPLAFVSNANFFVSPLATASSGLPVSYSALTTSVCTISGSKATMVRAGLCIIAADQAGNASVSAAPQATQSITLTGAAPGAPNLTTATPGDTRITLVFTAPANDGGSTITSYTATCGAFTASGPSSPLIVNGLTNGVSYNCSVTATNATGTSAPSAVQAAIPAASPGAIVWANTCANCHSFPTGFPNGIRLNAGGTTTSVIDYVIPRVPIMAGTPFIANMTPADRLAVADYISEFIPAVTVNTQFNMPVDINVGTQVYLNTQTAAFTALEAVTLPSFGTLSMFSDTVVTYTPNPGFTGTDTFTYRATQAGLLSDTRMVTVTVLPAAPSITSSLNASAIVGQAFNYQIAATNAPTSYNATGLPAGLSVDVNAGVISGIPLGSGVSMITISATGTGGTGAAMLVLSVGLTPQVITFGAQTTATRSYVSGGTFAVVPVATGGGSGNPVTYSSLTTGVCTVSSTTVTIVSAGICTIAADQAGNGTFAAAAQVQQSVSISAVSPGAPIIGIAVPGNTQATINFTPPADSGGLPIKDYTVNCNGVIATGSASPIVVSGLTNGVSYSCSVQASNVAFTGPSSATVNVTPISIAFNGNVFSRKFHTGIALGMDIPINPATVITGAVDVEPRVIGSGHQIVFQFNNPPTSVNSVAVTDVNSQPIGSNAVSFVGNEVIVTLTSIPDNKRVKVSLTGVNGAIDVSASIGFLVGDFNNSRSVTATDVSAVKSRSTNPVTAANFMFDVNLNGGLINAADISAVKARAGLQLP